MKTFLLDALNKIRRFDESLDIKTVLCNKPWLAFDESDSKTLYIFKEDGGLVITSQGKGRETCWEYLSANKTIKFKDLDNTVELYHPTVFDDSLLVLNLDSTNEYAMLLNENAVFKPRKLEDIILHIRKLDDTTPSPKPIPTRTSSEYNPSKEKKAGDSRKEIQFAGEVFSPAEKDGKKFYVNQDHRYAFTSIDHVFMKAILARKEDGYHLFYYNDSFENVYRTYYKPTWTEYWDGLVLDGILLDQRFIYRNGVWSSCSHVLDGYYKIDGNDNESTEYFKIDGEHLISATKEEIEKRKKEKEAEEKNNNAVWIGFVLVVAFFFVIAIICAAV